MKRIPNTPSAAWAIPGLPGRDTMKVAVIPTPENVRRFIRYVEQAFGLPEGAFQRRQAYNSAKASKTVDGVSLSDLRRAIGLHLCNTTIMTMKEIGAVLGTDHTGAIRARDTGRTFLEVGDARFCAVYQRVKEVTYL